MHGLLHELLEAQKLHTAIDISMGYSTRVPPISNHMSHQGKGRRNPIEQKRFVVVSCIRAQPLWKPTVTSERRNVSPPDRADFVFATRRQPRQRQRASSCKSQPLISVQGNSHKLLASLRRVPHTFLTCGFCSLESHTTRHVFCQTFRSFIWRSVHQHRLC